MHLFSVRLLAGAALCWPLAATAAPDETPVVAAPDPTTDEVPAPQDDIIVVGRGETRQVQQLDQQDIALLAPGTSPLKAIEKLPSVNFQSADAFGAYEWAQRVSLRSFNQNQIGFTLDGIPLGDGSYANVNGLHISRAISSENIARTIVSQGAGAIGTQATNNLGGTIEFFSSDPKPEFGMTLNGTYGSENTVRAFGRLDTGELGDNGPSAYVSYALLDSDKWKGFGSQRQHQVNAKFIAPIGPVRLAGTFDYSDRREQDYQDLSLGMIRRLGLRNDNIANNYPLAVLLADVGANRGDTGTTPTNPAAGTAYPAPYATVDDVYFDAAGLREDYLASLGVETDADAAVHGQIKAYFHSNQGQGLWYLPYFSSPGGIPLAVRATEYDIKRKGVFGSVGGTLGFNDLTLGGWYERNDFRQARRFYALGSRTVSTRNALEFQKNSFLTQWDLEYPTDTIQYHVQDRIALGAVTVSLGWKGFRVVNKAEGIFNPAGTRATGRIAVTDWFQPVAGVNYKLTDKAELFANFTQVTRAFTASATGGPFSTTQVAYDGLRALDNLKPEQSDTYEVGGRYAQRGFNALLAAYYVDFRDRQIVQTVGIPQVGNASVLQNVGSVRSYGIEAAAEAKIGQGFGVFASYSYNDSTYRDNAGTAAIRGKTTVDSPKHLAKGELTYDRDMFFGRIGANYMSRRYFTYTNDQSVPGRVLVDATIGARVTIADRKFEIQGNATNLFDRSYVATIGSNGFTNSGDSQTLLAGAPQQFFVTVKAGF